MFSKIFLTRASREMAHKVLSSSKSYTATRGEKAENFPNHTSILIVLKDIFLNLMNNTVHIPVQAALCKLIWSPANEQAPADPREEVPYGTRSRPAPYPQGYSPPPR